MSDEEETGYPSVKWYFNNLKLNLKLLTDLIETAQHDKDGYWTRSYINSIWDNMNGYLRCKDAYYQARKAGEQP